MEPFKPLLEKFALYAPAHRPISPEIFGHENS